MMSPSPHRRTQRVRTLRKWFLNSFAVTLTLLPVFSAGYWAMALSSGDGRTVAALRHVSRTQARPFSEPLVSITFDDGWQSTYANGVPVLQRYGMPVTFYVLSGEVKEAEYMSESQISSLYAAGYEIGSHGVDHRDMATLSAADAARELDDSRAMLRRLHVADDTLSFASPYSSYTPGVLQQITSRYYAHRNTLADIASVGPEDMNMGPGLPKRDIVAFTVRNTTPLSQLKAALAYAKTHNAWFVLVYHQVDDSGSLYSVSPEMLAAQLNMIKVSGIKVAALGDVAGEIPRGGN